MRSCALSVLLLASACAARPAELTSTLEPGLREPAPLPGRVRIHRDALDASAATSPPPPLVALQPVSLAPRPPPRDGVRCVVYGRGAGLAAPCGANVSVVASRSATEPEANVELENADFALGFFPGRTKAWVHVDDGTFSVDGFVEPTTVPLALRREVDIVEDHVWLKANAAVYALGADEGGVAVKLDEDDNVIIGFDDIPSRVPCESLVFDRDAFPSPGTEPQGDVVYPARDKLALFLAPDARMLAQLGSKEAPFFRALAVLAREPGWTRVGFETSSARLDLWAKSDDLVDVATWGNLIGSSSCCGGGIMHGVSSDLAGALEATPVLVGFSPRGKPSGVVTLLEGAVVQRGAKQNGFTAVRPLGWSAIAPPLGASFWVPTDKLGPAG